MISKILGVASVGSSLAGLGMLHRFLQSLMHIMVLTLISAFVLSLVFVSALSIIYFCLVYYGINPTIAGAGLAIIAFFVTSGLLVVTVNRLRCLRESSFCGLHKEEKNWPDVIGLAGAFVDGFVNHKK